MSEDTITLDFSKTCRTCLVQDNNMHPVNTSIKTAQNNNFVIKDMLLSCTQIQVSDDDGLPSQVCLKCVVRVSDAYIFRQNCEKSQNTLQEYLSNKLNCASTQIIQSESENCETFKDNVMNLINIAVDEATGLDQALMANNDLINKIENESHSLNGVNIKNLNENSINNENIHNTTIAIQQLKVSRKRKKLPKRFNSRSEKMTRIAPKSPLNSCMAYNEQGKFVTINISGNNVMIGDKPAKLTKLPENIEIKGQCKMCGIYFIYEHELKSHLKEVHSLNDLSEPMKYICNICNIEFALYDELNEHNILEHYKDAFQCDECLNYYASKHILNRHKRFTHGKMVEELACEMCPKKFDSVRGLSIHKTFHNTKTSENKIFCKICDRTFNVMANLTYHMKYHKTDVCQYCNQGFCNTSMMKDHMKEIHSDDKPYHCPYCNKKFNIRKVLLKHRRIAHGVYDDIYFCGICKNNNVGFITHEFLLKHIEKYHKLPQNPSSELLEDAGLKFNDSTQVDHENVINTTNDPQCSFLNLQDMSEKVSNVEDTICNSKDLSFDNALTNSNLSELIDLTNEVNSSQITLNDDGTINISINDSQVQNIQVSEVADESLISTQDFEFGEAIENTIKVLKEEIFNDHKNENNFSITEMGGYTINEINTEENNIEENINHLQNTTESEQNLDFNDSLMSGKIIDYDEENQQYTINYEGAEYIISASSLNQTNNIHYEAAEPDNFNNSVDSNSNENDNSAHSAQQIVENIDEDITDNLICKLCNITFVDQTSYNNHVPKHNKAARGLDTLTSQQESAVESSNDIKEGMIRINIDNASGIVAHEKTDLIFAKEDYNSAPEPEENKADVPRYRCPKCDDLFTRQYSLNRHLAHIHNELCLVCNTCGEGFNRVSLLEEHRLKHKNMLNMGVIITSVEKSATGDNDPNNETQHAIHEITESLYVYEPENQSFPCEFCDKTFQRQIYLERHRVVHLGINQPGFMCSTCNKIFLTAVDMQKHKRKHNEEYLQCNLCDRTFTTLGGLKYHLKTHTGNKNHKCPFCGKKFTANINLNAHIKTVHSEVKPHLCNICGKRYTTSDHLRKHMVYHTGERKFQCGVCGRDFTQNSHLTQHSWIHSGIKPYACKYCDNKYTSSSALKKHMHSIHTL